MAFTFSQSVRLHLFRYKIFFENKIFSCKIFYRENKLFLLFNCIPNQISTPTATKNQDFLITHNQNRGQRLRKFKELNQIQASNIFRKKKKRKRKSQSIAIAVPPLRRPILKHWLKSMNCVYYRPNKNVQTFCFFFESTTTTLMKKKKKKQRSQHGLLLHTKGVVSLLLFYTNKNRPSNINVIFFFSIYILNLYYIILLVNLFLLVQNKISFI